MTSSLWSSIVVGEIRLKHRVAMAPMTRDRATAEGVPTQMNATYYAQRASMALIITEGTQPSDDGQGYLLTPGIYTTNQIAGWRLVTDAVHESDGHIFIQLMHVGRMSHPSNTPHGRQPVGPSPVKPAGVLFTASGRQELPIPRELSEADIADTIRDYRHAAASAIAAGADGVEIHAANGYLLHQFLSSNANVRSDDYGSSIANRIRFTVEVATAIAEEIGASRTGIIISPGNKLNDIVENDVPELYGALLQALGPIGLAYLNVVFEEDEGLIRDLRRDWKGIFFLNRPGTDIETRAKDIEEGLADVITVGTRSLANPDLIDRIKAHAPLNSPDPSTFYGGGEHGYTDYPTMESTFVSA